jgi:hypothetical protein
MRWEENVECMVEKKWMHSGGRILKWILQKQVGVFYFLFTSTITSCFRDMTRHLPASAGLCFCLGLIMTYRYTMPGSMFCEHIIKLQDVLVKWLVLQLYIQEVLASKLGTKTGYLEVVHGSH